MAHGTMCKTAQNLATVEAGTTPFFIPSLGTGLVQDSTVTVVACNGRARKDGNTAILVSAVFRELKKEVKSRNSSSVQEQNPPASLRVGNVREGRRAVRGQGG